MTVNYGGTPTSTCATPTFNPAAGTYTQAQNVTISCATEGATIYYTTNGDVPTTSSTVYADPISVSSNMTIKAMAAAQGYDNSAVATAAYTIVNIEHAGTEADPYTVADARTAIDANAGTQGVYATGIVSAIPTAWNGQYNNITFNFVDNEGDTDFLQAYRCVSTDNADASTVAVGDVVVVFGDLTKYGSTYEFNSGCQLVSLTHPTVAVEAPTFSPAAGIYDEVQNVTLSCATDGATIYYTIDGSEPTNASTLYSTAINVATTTTIKAIAVKGEDSSAVATATYTIVPVANISSISEVGTEYTVRGTVVAINSRGFIMGDGTGYVYYYKNDAVSQSVGDKLKVLGTTGSYGHIIQFTNSATVTEATTSNYNNTPAAILITEVPDYTEGYYLSTYFEFEGELTTTSGNYLIALGESQIQISYPTQAQKDALNALSGKNVHVKGYFSGINSSDKFTVMLESVEEVASTEPSITFDPDEFDLAAEMQTIQIPFTYENIVVTGYQSFTVHHYNAEGEEIQPDPEAPWYIVGVTGNNDEGYMLTVFVSANEGEARSAYVKVTALDAASNTVPSNLVTINQEAYVAPTYAELPFAFNGGKADIEGTDGLSQEGLDSDYASDNTKLKFNGTDDWLLLQFSERPGTLTFDIKGYSFSGGTFALQTSENGVDFSTLKSYTNDNFGESVYSEEFTDLGENVRYIKWIYTNKVSGNVGLGNITLGEYVAPQPSITVETNVIDVDAESHQEFLNVNFVNFEPTTGYAFTCDANGTFTDYSWLVAELDINNNRVRYTIGNNEEVARTGYFRVKCGDVYSEIVTVNQAAYVAPAEPGTWVLTDLADLTEDDVFVIVGDNGDTYAMSNDNGTSSAPTAVAVTVAEGTLSAEPTANLQWNLSITDNGYIFYPNGNAETWLYCTNTNNGVRVGINADNNVFTVSENGYLRNIATGRYIGIYNSQDWRCYTSEGGNIADQTFAFYKKEEATPADPTITVAGYGESDGGYVLIASPTVEYADPMTIGMATGSYDLYYYDAEQDLEWRNYQAQDGGNYNLEPGKGYLYANQEEVTITFTGELNPAFSDVELPYTANNLIKSLYLAGNSSTQARTFYVNDGNYDHQTFNYLTMNEDGDGFISAQATSYTAPAMTGFFVQAPGEDMYLSTYNINAKANVSLLNINVLRNRGSVVDNAIVSFSNGSMMEKFYLKNNTTRVYIPQGNREMAIANSATEAEMPVSFRASENGTYTLSIEAENVEMNYLHLIDNMTGADVDLLATPNYTFEARTNDYTSRFRLVFSANDIDEQNAETFAYFNGTNWTVSNTGDATLQVVDITGRIVSSETINGNATVSLNQPAGIYMLRLVNGNDVKVQKVVVR